MLVVDPPVDYIPPTDEQCRTELHAAGVRLRPAALADLAALFAGGEVAPPSRWNPQYEEADLQPWADFLLALDGEAPSGGTPLQRAVSVLAAMQATGSLLGGGETPPVFANEPNEVARSVKQLAFDTRSLSDEVRELLPHDMSPEEVREIAHVARTLHALPATQLAVLREREIASDGPDRRTRTQESMSEVGRTREWHLRARAPKLWRLRAVTNTLTVRERVATRERKQALFLLVDASGSMEGRRATRAYGVVLTQLASVARGEAVVWVSMFDDRTRKPVRVDATNVREFAERFRHQCYSGGGTDVERAVRYAHAQVTAAAAAEDLHSAQIMIVTDDDGGASGLTPSDIPGVQLHAVVVEENGALLSLARATGGEGVQLV